MARKTLVTLPAQAWYGYNDSGTGLDGPAIPGLVQGRAAITFDPTDNEAAFSISFLMPDRYAGGTLKADIFYCMAQASNSVDFELAVEAITDADATDMDAGTSFDTANTANATCPATAGYSDILVITLTNKDSVAVNDLVTLRLERDADDATNDTNTGIAYIFAVELYEDTA